VKDKSAAADYPRVRPPAELRHRLGIRWQAPIFNREAEELKACAFAGSLFASQPQVECLGLLEE